MYLDQPIHTETETDTHGHTEKQIDICVNAHKDTWTPKGIERNTNNTHAD